MSKNPTPSQRLKEWKLEAKNWESERAKEFRVDKFSLRWLSLLAIYDDPHKWRLIFSSIMEKER